MKSDLMRAHRLRRQVPGFPSGSKPVCLSLTFLKSSLKTLHGTLITLHCLFSPIAGRCRFSAETELNVFLSFNTHRTHQSWRYGSLGLSPSSGLLNPFVLLFYTEVALLFSTASNLEGNGALQAAMPCRPC
jgi:hypothetical protein